MNKCTYAPWQASGNQNLAFSVLQAPRIFFMPKLALCPFTKAAKLQLEHRGLGAFSVLCKPWLHQSHWLVTTTLLMQRPAEHQSLWDPWKQHSPFHRLNVVAQDTDFAASVIKYVSALGLIFLWGVLKLFAKIIVQWGHFYTNPFLEFAGLEMWFLQCSTAIFVY